MNKLIPGALYSSTLNKKRTRPRQKDPVSENMRRLDPDGSKTRDLLRKVRKLPHTNS